MFENAGGDNETAARKQGIFCIPQGKSCSMAARNALSAGALLSCAILS
jgi:hypothetical protein